MQRSGLWVEPRYHLVVILGLLNVSCRDLLERSRFERSTAHEILGCGFLEGSTYRFRVMIFDPRVR